MEEDYERIFNAISNIDDEKIKDEKIREVYTKYSKYCYSNNININREFTHLWNMFNNVFIIDSRPIDYDIDEDKKLEALSHLKEVLNNNSGISQDEADIILKSTIQNARYTMSLEEDDFFLASLTGLCGYSQALTAILLQASGLKVTINNARDLPDSISSHAFITCTIPIKDNDKVVEKQYLLDATYRQFFQSIRCNEGRLYSIDNNTKSNIDAGYYVCKSDEGCKFAKELLTKGYIELTEENAYYYGNGFSQESIYLGMDEEEIKRITSHTGYEYIESINDKSKQRELECSCDEILQAGGNIRLYQENKNIKNKENLTR